jgi:hypothetical protein
MNGPYLHLHIYMYAHILKVYDSKFSLRGNCVMNEPYLHISVSISEKLVDALMYVFLGYVG